MKYDTCRLCGIKSEFEYLRHIFDEVTNVAQMINETLPIKVSQDDRSKSICLDCYNKVVSHYDFIQSILACSKESETETVSFLEVNRNERLQNVVISKMHSDMIYTCPSCHKDLILLLTSNSEGSDAFEISLAAVDKLEKLAGEKGQVPRDIVELASVCAQKSNTESDGCELNFDVVDNRQNVNGLHSSSQNDTNYADPYESKKGKKRKFQRNVSTKVSVSPAKLRKLEARLGVTEQDADELNSDCDRSSVTDSTTFQTMSNGIEYLDEKIGNEENDVEYTVERDKNFTKLETSGTNLDVKEQDELSSDYDRSSVAGLITIESGHNVAAYGDVEADVEGECRDGANGADNPNSRVKPVCNLCGARYISQTKYKFHMERHRLNKMDKFVCWICDKETRNESLLWDHYSHVHESPVRYVCADCDRAFAKKPTLKEHQRKHGHSGYKETPSVDADKDSNQKATRQRRKCTVCKKAIKHVDPNAVNDPAMCAFCEDASASPTVDGEANTKAIAQRQYHCFKCRKHFMRRERLEFHEMRHNENMDEFVCSTCGKDFSGENSLYEHYLFVHKGARPHICEVCGKSFQLKTRLREHQRKHTGEKPYQCEICGLRCMTTHSLKFHKKSHVPTRHTCEICGKAFIKKQNLNEHLEKHWKKDKNISLPRIFTCPVCRSDLPTYRMLKHHMTGTHQLDRQDPLILNQKPLYECNECQEKFSHQMSLKAHKEKVHEGRIMPRVFQCDICKTEFKIKQMLINHIKSKHSSEKRYKCAQCNVMFADMKTLYHHVLLHGKLYTCEYCNKSFRQKDVRDVHCRIHTSDRPYQCADCDMTFASYGSRSNHRKKAHGDNETECPECGEKCGDTQEIRIHLNAHLGEKLNKLEST
ncbi:PREDICTED: zinc finger protein 420-like [Vollenhovia emeryi]|uniref:zinc finger protein 420-like n=1 Tax=Vollenhovia emeryi TaxID=411798 RepID=UPI0005F3C90E|nr:PREDICTED: zinc finger protein 420-like [Vollenhovia emeryi]XP_011878183.1 PREDICTED: zinc finger protein 420-like [Vollenhovia emeryi]